MDISEVGVESSRIDISVRVSRTVVVCPWNGAPYRMGYESQTWCRTLPDC